MSKASLMIPVLLLALAAAAPAFAEGSSQRLGGGDKSMTTAGDTRDDPEDDPRHCKPWCKLVTEE